MEDEYMTIEKLADIYARRYIMGQERGCFDFSDGMALGINLAASLFSQEDFVRFKKATSRELERRGKENSADLHHKKEANSNG